VNENYPSDFADLHHFHSGIDRQKLADSLRWSMAFGNQRDVLSDVVSEVLCGRTSVGVTILAVLRETFDATN